MIREDSQMETVNALIEELKSDDSDVRWHATRGRSNHKVGKRGISTCWFDLTRV
jgi:hypothetical protein